jgi:phenylacetate-CoA ligase
MDPVSLFQRLPYPVRVAVASAQGAYLNWQRYGGDSERQVEEYLERDTWSADKLAAWQDDEVARLLARAEKHVPWYREHWAERRRRGDRASSEILANWPVLDKATVQAANRAFVADDCRIERMQRLRTTGTTGRPLTIWKSLRVLRRQYAGTEARWRRWYGISRRQPWALLGSRRIVAPDQSAPPFWVWNAGMRQLYLSSLHVTQRNAPAYHAELKAKGIRFLWGYPSAISALAEAFRRLRLERLDLACVVTNGEPLYGHQLQTIEDALGCPAYENYGLTEDVVAASQCLHRTRHLWPETGRLEVLCGETRTAVPDGASGCLVGTGLNNVDMPLIRYLTGDRGAVMPRDTRCACGRALPQLARIEGREQDLIYSPDGRRVPMMSGIFADLPIAEGQVVQEKVERLDVAVVPLPDWSNEHSSLITARVHSRLGPAVEVVVRLVEALPRSPSGKFRLSDCRLPAAERLRLDRLTQ